MINIRGHTAESATPSGWADAGSSIEKPTAPNPGSYNSPTHRCKDNECQKSLLVAGKNAEERIQNKETKKKKNCRKSLNYSKYNY